MDLERKIKKLKLMSVYSPTCDVCGERDASILHFYSLKCPYGEMDLDKDLGILMDELNHHILLCPVCFAEGRNL